MYAIYGNMYHQYTPNVSIYIIHALDPMGMMDILMDENSEHFLGFPAFDP